MVGTILFLVAGRNTAAVVCLALAALTKPQAVILAPLVLTTIGLRRDWRAIVRGSLASGVLFVLLSLPFFLYGRAPQLFRTLVTAVGVNPYLSPAAFNLWWLATGGDGVQPDTIPIVGSLTPRLLGLLLFGASAVFALWRVYRDQSRDSVILAAAFTCLAFFVLCTQMTERYVLPALFLFLLIAPASRRFAGVFVLLAVTSLINIYVFFPLVLIAPWDALHLPHSNFYYYLQPAVAAPLPVLTLLDPIAQKTIPLTISVIHLVLLGYLAVRVWPGRRRLAAMATVLQPSLP